MQFGIDAHGGERDGEGNATYTRNLSRSLLALDGDDTFTLFASDAGHPFYRSLRAGPRLRIHSLAPRGGLGRIVWTLGRAATRDRVDALHVQYFAPLQYRGPVVVTVHDLAFLHVPGAFPPSHRAFMRALVPWSLRRASHVIAVSEFTRRDIAARYGVDHRRITAIWNGVDERFRPLPERETRDVLARYGLEPGFLFFAARLNRRKNLGSLLRALGAVGARGPGKPALVIGGKPDHGAREIMGAARRSDPSRRIHWVGLIPEADLPAFYAGAACFIYPSLFEGFGLPLLEAMACGCPVISSNRTSCPEIVGEAGLLVDPEDANAIAAAIDRILADEDLRASLRQRGLARSRLFTWEETARRTLAVLYGAAGSSG